MNESKQSPVKRHWLRWFTIAGAITALKWAKELLDGFESLVGWASGDNENNTATTVGLVTGFLEKKIPWMLVFIDKIAPPIGLIALAVVFVAFCVDKWKRRTPQNAATVEGEQPKKTLGQAIAKPDVTLADIVAASTLPTSTSESPRFAMARQKFSRRKSSENKGDGSARATVRSAIIQPITLFRTTGPDRMPDLRIEYDKSHHLTRDPSGLVQFRLRVKNNGTTPIRGLKVSLKSLSPLTQAKKLSPYTTQFNDVPLRFAKPEFASVLNPGDGVEIFVCCIRPDAPKDLFFSSVTQDFHLPRGKVLASILATAENANPAEQKFEVEVSGKLLVVKPLLVGEVGTTSQKPLLRELVFDKPLYSPEWIVHPNERIGLVHESWFRVIPETVGHPRCLEINVPHATPVTHEFHGVNAKRIEIVGKFTASSIVHLKFSGSDGEKRVERDLWLLVERGTKPIENHSVPGRREWTKYFSPKVDKKTGDWEMISLSLPRDFKDTFGRDGFTYIGLNGIRFRGKATMSRITVW